MQFLIISPIALWLSTIWDVVTNALIITLPLVILLHTSIPARAKAPAAIRFCSTLVITWISIARVAGSYAVVGIDKIFWLHLWGVLQCALFASLDNSLAFRSHRKAVSDQSGSGGAQQRARTNSLLDQTRTDAVTASLCPRGTIPTVEVRSRYEDSVSHQGPVQEHLNVSRPTI
jgi:hypothetical protein